MHIAGQAVELGYEQGSFALPAGLQGSPKLRPAGEGIAALAGLNLRKLAQELPAAAVQVVQDGGPLGIQAEPALALPLGADSVIGDELAPSHGMPPHKSEHRRTDVYLCSRSFKPSACDRRL